MGRTLVFRRRSSAAATSPSVPATTQRDLLDLIRTVDQIAVVKPAAIKAMTNLGKAVLRLASSERRARTRASASTILAAASMLSPWIL